MDNATLAALAAAGWALALPGWMLYLLRPGPDGAPLGRKRAVVIPAPPDPEERAREELRAIELDHATATLVAESEKAGHPVTWERAREEAERLLRETGLWGK